jgi:hypothetical protein
MLEFRTLNREFLPSIQTSVLQCLRIALKLTKNIEGKESQITSRSDNVEMWIDILITDR